VSPVSFRPEAIFYINREMTRQTMVDIQKEQLQVSFNLLCNNHNIYTNHCVTGQHQNRLFWAPLISEKRLHLTVFHRCRKLVFAILHTKLRQYLELFLIFIHGCSSGVSYSSSSSPESCIGGFGVS
jgi:hypothetical protein